MKVKIKSHENVIISGTYHYMYINTTTGMFTNNVLYNQLVTYGVSTKVIVMIIKLYSTVTSRLKVNNTLSDSFECRNGLRQGKSLSPVLESYFSFLFLMQKSIL